MNEQIQFLINLQGKDTAIFELNEILKSLPIRIEQWRQNYKAKEDQLSQMQKEKESIEKDLRSKERNLQIVEDDLKKFRKRIYEVKTQKEMISLDHEINKGEEEKGKLEEDIINLFEGHDELINKSNSLSVELEKESDELKKEEEEVKRKIELNTDKLNLSIEQRKEISEKIAKETLVLYERIRAAKNNLAVVPIKDNTCQGCFVKLPPQIINEVKGASHIVRCEGCVRILYYKEG